METVIGAGWAHGTLPPWMEQPPWFDEADAADRADLLAVLRAEQLPADLLAERFGPLGELTAEHRRVPRPVALAALAALAAARREPSAVRDWQRTIRKRRAALEAALHPTDFPAADDRRAA